jgi:hypothetical protein
MQTAVLVYPDQQICCRQRGNAAAGGAAKDTAHMLTNRTSGGQRKKANLQKVLQCALAAPRIRPRQLA